MTLEPNKRLPLNSARFLIKSMSSDIAQNAYGTRAVSPAKRMILLKIRISGFAEEPPIAVPV